MSTQDLNKIADNKAFIAACAQFAKENGISSEDWNANKGAFVGLILGMAKLHGHDISFLAQ